MDYEKYLNQLSKEYPTVDDTISEIVMLKALSFLPIETE